MTSKLKFLEIPKFEHERFFKFIKINGDCWDWGGSINNKGYGSFRIGVKTYKAHRVSFFIFTGNLNAFLLIDHICRNKKCVNPDHLREVNYSTNSRENSVSSASKMFNKTHCTNGHEFTQSNISIASIGISGYKRRRCRECERLRSKKRRALKR